MDTTAPRPPLLAFLAVVIAALLCIALSAHASTDAGPLASSAVHSAAVDAGVVHNDLLTAAPRDLGARDMAPAVAFAPPPATVGTVPELGRWALENPGTAFGFLLLLLSIANAWIPHGTSRPRQFLDRLAALTPPDSPGTLKYPGAASLPPQLAMVAHFAEAVGAERDRLGPPPPPSSPLGGVMLALLVGVALLGSGCATGGGIDWKAYGTSTAKACAPAAIGAVVGGIEAKLTADIDAAIKGSPSFDRAAWQAEMQALGVKVGFDALACAAGQLLAASEPMRASASVHSALDSPAVPASYRPYLEAVFSVAVRDAR